jgi:pilus assembly protein CpaC
MKRAMKGNKTILLLILVIGLLLPVAVMAAGPERVRINQSSPENLTIVAGKSVIVESPSPIKRFSITQPNVADVIVLTPKQMYLTGKAPGVTSLSIWTDADKLSAVFDVEVTPDISSLKNKLHTVFPEEKDIQVKTSGDSIILTGTVSNAENLSQVLAIANSYAPAAKKGEESKKIINLLQVGGVQQVMLEVRVSEISKSIGRKMGIKFNAIGRLGQDGNVSYLSSPTNRGYALEADGGVSVLSAVDRILPGVVSATAAAGLGNLSFIKIARDVTWTGLIDALKERGLVKVLAEPTLITMSGKKANFLAGGEYPIPVPGSGTGGSGITIDYKTFGVGLNFTPTVLGNGKISMEVAPEVSDLDFTNAVYLSGYVVPGLTVRRVSTTVELGDGQSFAVAGLLNDNVREVVKKVPFLGDIPVLGLLFRSSEFQKNETELVIIVTPHLVKPLDMAKQTLPTDQFVEPNDMEFYLLGLEEGIRGNTRMNSSASSRPSVAGGGGLDGDFGHIIP